MLRFNTHAYNPLIYLWKKSKSFLLKYFFKNTVPNNPIQIQKTAIQIEHDTVRDMLFTKTAYIRAVINTLQALDLNKTTEDRINLLQKAVDNFNHPLILKYEQDVHVKKFVDEARTTGLQAIQREVDANCASKITLYKSYYDGMVYWTSILAETKTIIYFIKNSLYINDFEKGLLLVNAKNRIKGDSLLSLPDILVEERQILLKEIKELETISSSGEVQKKDAFLKDSGNQINSINNDLFSLYKAEGILAGIRCSTIKHKLSTLEQLQLSVKKVVENKDFSYVTQGTYIEEDIQKAINELKEAPQDTYLNNQQKVNYTKAVISTMQELQGSLDVLEKQYDSKTVFDSTPLLEEKLSFLSDVNTDHDLQLQQNKNALKTRVKKLLEKRIMLYPGKDAPFILEDYKKANGLLVTIALNVQHDSALNVSDKKKFYEEQLKSLNSLKNLTVQQEEEKNRLLSLIASKINPTVISTNVPPAALENTIGTLPLLTPDLGSTIL